eukprot:g14365.t1
MRIPEYHRPKGEPWKSRQNEVKEAIDEAKALLNPFEAAVADRGKEEKTRLEKTYSVQKKQQNLDRHYARKKAEWRAESLRRGLQPKWAPHRVVFDAFKEETIGKDVQPVEAIRKRIVDELEPVVVAEGAGGRQTLKKELQKFLDQDEWSSDDEALICTDVVLSEAEDAQGTKIKKEMWKMERFEADPAEYHKWFEKIASPAIKFVQGYILPACERKEHKALAFAARGC